jgi:hypothetical protein
MRKHTVFVQLARILVLMAEMYAHAVANLLQKVRDRSMQGGEDFSFPATLAAGRYLWSLALMLHTIQECVDDHVLVQEAGAVEALILGCQAMYDSLRIALPGALSMADRAGKVSDAGNVDTDKLGCDYVRGCTVFADLFTGLPSADQRVCAFTVLAVPARQVNSTVMQLGLRLSNVSWHQGTACAGKRLVGMSGGILCFVNPTADQTRSSKNDRASIGDAQERVLEEVQGGDVQEGVLEEVQGGDTEDELDEIVLHPNHQRTL